MFVFEIAGAVTVLAFFVRENPFLESQLVVCFDTFYHIFYLRSVGSDILDSGSTCLTGDQRQVLDPSPAVGNGMRNNVVPLLSGPDTQPDMLVGFLLHADTFDGRV